MTCCSCLFCAVGVRSPAAADAQAAAPALLPAGDFACGELVDVVLQRRVRCKAVLIGDPLGIPQREGGNITPSLLYSLAIPPWDSPKGRT